MAVITTQPITLASGTTTQINLADTTGQNLVNTHQSGALTPIKIVNASHYVIGGDMDPTSINGTDPINSQDFNIWWSNAGKTVSGGGSAIADCKSANRDHCR